MAVAALPGHLFCLYMQDIYILFSNAHLFGMCIYSLRNACDEEMMSIWEMWRWYGASDGFVSRMAISRTS